MVESAFVFGLLGNVISFMVFLAPVHTFGTIYKKKSAEGFQSINYVVGLFSAMLWIYYAFLRPGNMLLVTINSFGCFIETVYLLFYLFYASRNARIRTAWILLITLLGFGVIILVTQWRLLVKPENRGEVIGWICLVFSLCVFVAPLAILRKVIRTKSVEYMPILLSVFLTLSAVVWFFYGLFLHDLNIAIPNVLGLILGVLQIVLYFVYKGKKQAIDQKLPQVQLPHIISMEEHKIPELKEQIVDVVKLSKIVLSEIVPVVKMEDEIGFAINNIPPPIPPKNSQA